MDSRLESSERRQPHAGRRESLQRQRRSFHFGKMRFPGKAVSAQRQRFVPQSGTFERSWLAECGIHKSHAAVALRMQRCCEWAGNSRGGAENDKKCQITGRVRRVPDGSRDAVLTAATRTFGPLNE